MGNEKPRHTTKKRRTTQTTQQRQTMMKTMKVPFLGLMMFTRGRAEAEHLAKMRAEIRAMLESESADPQQDSLKIEVGKLQQQPQLSKSPVLGKKCPGGHERMQFV